MTRAAFHAAMPTDIADEIDLAENLILGGWMRYGKERFARRLRTDPADVFRRCHYLRLAPQNTPDRGYWIATGFSGDDDYLGYKTKATVNDILTPSHEQWNEFSERLLSLLVADDFSWRYAPAGDDYWPLASAEIVRGMGFAVAESLAVFGAFCGTNDRGIYDHVAGCWRRTPPRKGRRAVRCSRVDAAPARTGVTKTSNTMRPVYRCRPHPHGHDLFRHFCRNRFGVVPHPTRARPLLRLHCHRGRPHPPPPARARRKTNDSKAPCCRRTPACTGATIGLSDF